MPLNKREFKMKTLPRNKPNDKKKLSNVRLNLKKSNVLPKSKWMLNVKG
jgi:hypothetical protein